MKKKLTVISLVAAICFAAVTSALAYNEAPMLRVMVAAGELPPVEGRIGEEPLVLEPLEEIGQYGGTINVFVTDVRPWQDLQESTERGGFLLRILPGLKIVGNLAKGYELSEDKKALTLYLRKGVKWSDGAPFTADDIIFTFEDMVWNEEVNLSNRHPLVKRIVKVDDYTLRFEGDESLGRMPLDLGTWYGGDWNTFHPKHYLKKWHIRYNPEADELAKEEGFDNWWNAFYYHWYYSPQKDLNKPTMQPFFLTESTTTIKLHERNRYYWKVDTDGNQHPYIDKVVATIVDAEVYQLKIISGESDIAFAFTKFTNYPLYKENEESGNYRVVSIPGVSASEVALALNVNEPDLALRKIYQDVRFRQALSLAIDRDEINETCFFGLAVPRQGTVLPDTSYYKPEWGEEHPFARYDPDEANNLLDEMGLTERRDGFRMGPDGKPLVLLVEYGTETSVTPLELVREYWEDVGIKVQLKPEEMTLFHQRKRSVEHGVIAHWLGAATELGNYTSDAEPWNPLDLGDHGYAQAWRQWLQAEQDVRLGQATLQDFEEGKLPGEEPPEEIKQLRDWVWERGKSEIGSQKYMELSEKIYDFHAENLYLIGTVGMAPQVVIAKKNMGNVPEAFGIALDWWGGLNVFVDQLFWRQES